MNKSTQLAGLIPISDIASRSPGFRGKVKPGTSKPPPLFIPRSILFPPDQPPLERNELSQAAAEIALMFVGAFLVTFTGVGSAIGLFLLFFVEL